MVCIIFLIIGIRWGQEKPDNFTKYKDIRNKCSGSPPRNDATAYIAIEVVEQCKFVNFRNGFHCTFDSASLHNKKEMPCKYILFVDSYQNISEFIQKLVSAL